MALSSRLLEGFYREENSWLRKGDGVAHLFMSDQASRQMTMIDE